MSGTCGSVKAWKRFIFICSHKMGLQCLKITEKVSFNIASEASYVYIFSEQKFIKDAKIDKFNNETFWVILNQCGSSFRNKNEIYLWIMGLEGIFYGSLLWLSFWCNFCFSLRYSNFLFNGWIRFGVGTKKLKAHSETGAFW